MPRQHALRTKVGQTSFSRRRRTRSGWNVLEEWEQAGRRGEKFIAFFIVDILMSSLVVGVMDGPRQSQEKLEWHTWAAPPSSLPPMFAMNRSGHSAC